MFESRGRGVAHLRDVLAILGAMSLLSSAAFADTAADSVTPPPGPRPIRVEVGFYLLNLVSVDERSETFDADVYLNVRWKDPRLAFPAPHGEAAVRSYQGDDAVSRLDGVWWPDLEFVNTAGPNFTNRVLTVASDGTVDYRLGLSATFRTSLDLRRFPFDEQVLEVRIRSFEGDEKLLVLVADPGHLGYAADERYAGLTVEDVTTESRTAKNVGWNETLSEFVVRIRVVRSPAFFVWTVFVPVGLVLLLCCTIFFVEIKNFHDRVAIALACFLACIATQFAMSFNLPRISYLTPIDRLFLVTYSLMALAVGVSVFEQSSLRERPEAIRRADRLGRAGIPLLYAILVYFVVLP